MYEEKNSIFLDNKELEGIRTKILYLNTGESWK